MERLRHSEALAAATAAPGEESIVDTLIDFPFDPSDVGVANVEGEARVSLPGGLMIDAGVRVVQTFPPKVARYIGELILAAARAAECPTCGPQALAGGPGTISAATCACPPT